MKSFSFNEQLGISKYTLIHISDSGVVTPLSMTDLTSVLPAIYGMLMTNGGWVLYIKRRTRERSMGLLTVPINLEILGIIRSINYQVTFNFSDHTPLKDTPSPCEVYPEACVMDTMGYNFSENKDWESDQRHVYYDGMYCQMNQLDALYDYLEYQLTNQFLTVTGGDNESLVLPTLSSLTIDGVISDKFDRIREIILTEFMPLHMPSVTNDEIGVIYRSKNEHQLLWTTRSQSEFNWKTDLKRVEEVFLPYGVTGTKSPCLCAMSKKNFKYFKAMSSIELIMAVLPATMELEDAFGQPYIESCLNVQTSLSDIAMLIDSVPLIFENWMRLHREATKSMRGCVGFLLKGYINRGQVESLPVYYMLGERWRFCDLVPHYITNVIKPHIKLYRGD